MKVTKDQLDGSDHQDLSKVYAHGRTGPEKLEEDLTFIKEWLRFQNHLPYDMIDDNTIRQYLIGSKGDLEKTKTKLDDRSSVRHDIAPFFKDRMVKGLEFENSCKTTNICLCPQLSEDACRISILTFEPNSSDKYVALSDLKRLYMISDLWMKKGTLFTGEDAILDMKNYTEKHRDKLGIQTLVQWINTIKMLPTRLNKFIIINSTGFIETLFKLIKPFLSEKLQNRFFIYSKGHEVLKEHFNLEVLPKDLGGTSDFTVKELSDFWTEQLRSNADWLCNEANFFSVESKRVEGKKINGDTFGMEGTFRKINID